MEITVNHEVCIVDDPCSVTQLLSAVLSISTTGIAVAVNETVVPRSGWPAYTLRPKDQVILIKAIQGG